MITVISITRAQASLLSGKHRLPAGCNWYLATNIQYYPHYGDWRHVWAGEDGMTAVIGKQRAQEARLAA